MEATPQGQGVEPLSPRIRRRRPLLFVVAGGLAVLVLVTGLAAIAMVGVRGDLQRGQRALQDARRALVSGNVRGASDAFTEATDAFNNAEDRAGGLAARAGSWLPLVGNNVDVGAGLARAGADLASAGVVLADALGGLPDGLGSLAPQDGRIPVDDIADLAAPVSEAAERAASAASEVEATPASFLVGPVAEARWDALDQITDAATALESADVLLGELPAFAGSRGPRRYLVASENPAELRGTGGIWGAYAALTLDDGEPSFSRVRPIQLLPDVDADDVPPPSEDYERNYAEFGGAGSWQNLNMTTDFPTAARAAIGAFEAATDQRFDGMIVADPFALELMLRVTGPMLVPGTEIRLTADDVVSFTTNEAYSLFDRAIERKEILGSLAIDVFERFLAVDGKGIARIRALAIAASEGHLKVYTADASFERGLTLAGVDGSHAPPAQGDLLGVDLNDATGSKVDYYATRSVSHVIQLGGLGEAVATTTVSIDNGAPTSGEPRYVIGPFVKELSRGDHRALTRLSCHDPCTLVEARADGVPIELVGGSEGGVPWFRDFETIHAGDDRELAVVTRTEGVWEGNGSGGVYRLTVPTQTTIKPTKLTVRIEAPPGTEIVWTSEEMSVEGGVATWEGEAPSVLELEVRFRAPVPLRWWRNLLRPFGGN